jgi:hypothetical protein
MLALAIKKKAKENAIFGDLPHLQDDLLNADS